MKLTRVVHGCIASDFSGAYDGIAYRGEGNEEQGNKGARGRHASS